MTHNHDGKSFGIPYCRRLTWDLLHFNRSVPLCGHDRFFQLGALASERSHCAVRVSWPALFLKAFGLLAAEVPELRQTWFRWPWAQIYQHPNSVGIVTVQREFQGQRWLFWGRIPTPESQSLPDIQQRIDEYRGGTISELFKKELQLVRLPTALRRLIWGWNIHMARQKRMKRLGTFFLSTLASKGVEIQIPPSIHTTCLTYGPLDDRGRCKVTFAYDHRIMDGALVAECLERLEAILTGTLSQELSQLRSG